MAEQLLAFARGWEGLGLIGLCALALVFMLGTLTFMPRFTFYSIGGAVFGLAATRRPILGSVIGAAIAFLIARYAAHDAFQRQVAKRPSWRRLLAAVNAEGWRLVVLTRFTSPLPGGAINYVFGLTAIELVPYIVATAWRTAAAGRGLYRARHARPRRAVGRRTVARRSRHLGGEP